MSTTRAARTASEKMRDWPRPARLTPRIEHPSNQVHLSGRGNAGLELAESAAYLRYYLDLTKEGPWFPPFLAIRLLRAYLHNHHRCLECFEMDRIRGWTLAEMPPRSCPIPEGLSADAQIAHSLQTCLFTRQAGRGESKVGKWRRAVQGSADDSMARWLRDEWRVVRETCGHPTQAFIDPLLWSRASVSKYKNKRAIVFLEIHWQPSSFLLAILHELDQAVGDGWPCCGDEHHEVIRHIPLHNDFLLPLRIFDNGRSAGEFVCERLGRLLQVDIYYPSNQRPCQAIVRQRNGHAMVLKLTNDRNEFAFIPFLPLHNDLLRKLLFLSAFSCSHFSAGEQAEVLPFGLDAAASSWTVVCAILSANSN